MELYNQEDKAEWEGDKEEDDDDKEEENEEDEDIVRQLAPIKIP